MSRHRSSYAQLVASAIAIASFLLTGCDSGAKQGFRSISSSKSGIDFKNILKEDTDFNVLNYTYFYNGGGVAVGDLNRDGLPDIYFTGNLVRSHLYLNRGEMKFRETAEQSGVAAAGAWNTGVTMADVNADGWLDIYVCRSGASSPLLRKNLLFINNADPDQHGVVTFTESGSLHNVDDVGYSTQAAFLDYDRDGDLDLFLLNHSVPEYANFQGNLGTFKNKSNSDYGDKLFENELGLFLDVTPRSGLINNVLGFGLGVTTADFNGDHWVDIYVSNDFNEEDYLYINQQDGTFKEELQSHMGHTSLFSMGADAADINADGALDLVTLDMLPASNTRIKQNLAADRYDKYRLLLDQGFYRQSMRNMLHVNSGEGDFEEVGQMAGISNTDWSWSALFADYDLDGDQDLYVSNGYPRDYTNMDFLSYTVDQQLKNRGNNGEVDINEVLTKMPQIAANDQLFLNDGNGFFDNASALWGFNTPTISSGAAWGDLDLDGDLDLVVNQTMGIASLYQNMTQENEQKEYLKLRPVNQNGVVQLGTSVCISHQGASSTQTLFTTRGYQSSVEPILLFAVDPAHVEQCLVQWPNGESELFKVDQQSRDQTLEQGKGSPAAPSIEKEESLFILGEDSIHHHVEDRYNDFLQQPLLPRMYSRHGPDLAIGDLNGDGYAEVLMGGPRGQSIFLGIGQADGSLRAKAVPVFTEDRAYEDSDLHLVDIDYDGDLDLLVGSGISTRSLEDHSYLSLRLYEQVRPLQFRRSSAVLMKGPVNAIASADLDGDNQIEVFVGTGYREGHYPLSAKNYLLRFADRQWSILDSTTVKDHVSAAIMHDVDADGDIELVTAGEWTPITIYGYGGHALLNEWTSSEQGWWSNLLATNLDGDPALEIVAGNWGENSQLQASKERPLSVHYGDADRNGSIDAIMTYNVDGQNYPLVGRDDLIAQLPFLKKNMTSFQAYAEMNTQELLALLPDLDSLQSTTFSTLVYDREDNATWTATRLPDAAQTAPIFASAALDVDRDGDTDLILAGNSSYNRVALGEIDANRGTLLLNDGIGGFTHVSTMEAGLKLRGDVRALAMTRSVGATYLYVGTSDAPLKMYLLRSPEQVPQ
ncbi:MAG: VCBS repeat-containing protein [Saprospiraceae bacterium]|nr:VCBS repeat-containing protein [Saprospiraceae bacterium]